MPHFCRPYAISILTTAVIPWISIAFLVKSSKICFPALKLHNQPRLNWSVKIFDKIVIKIDFQSYQPLLIRTFFCSCGFKSNSSLILNLLLYFNCLFYILLQLMEPKPKLLRIPQAGIQLRIPQLWLPQARLQLWIQTQAILLSQPSLLPTQSGPNSEPFRFILQKSCIQKCLPGTQFQQPFPQNGFPQGKLDYWSYVIGQTFR